MLQKSHIACQATEGGLEKDRLDRYFFLIYAMCSYHMLELNTDVPKKAIRSYTLISHFND